MREMREFAAWSMNATKETASHLGTIGTYINSIASDQRILALTTIDLRLGLSAVTESFADGGDIRLALDAVAKRTRDSNDLLTGSITDLKRKVAEVAVSLDKLRTTPIPMGHTPAPPPRSPNNPFRTDPPHAPLPPKPSYTHVPTPAPIAPQPQPDFNHIPSLPPVAHMSREEIERELTVSQTISKNRGRNLRKRLNLLVELAPPEVQNFFHQNSYLRPPPPHVDP